MLQEVTGPTLARRAAALAGLHTLIRRMNADITLQATLDVVVQSVVDGLGFQVAVVNLVREDGDLEVIAVAGSAAARAELEGRRAARSKWDELLAAADRIGTLCFLDHRRSTWPDDDIPTWVPQDEGSGVEGAWHSLDALFAPLCSPSAGLIGVLSVDLPHDGMRPGAEQLEMLEMFAAQASIAIENSRLLAEARAARKADKTELLARLTTLVEATPVAIVEVDLAGRVLMWNAAAEQIFGWTREEVLGRSDPLVTETIWAGIKGLMAKLARGEPVTGVELIGERKDGSVVEVEMSAALLHDRAGEVSGIVLTLADITERKRLRDQLHHQAFHDALTGLPNRSLFDDRLTHALARSGRSGDSPSVLLLDLDGFKAVNDQLGHAAGDQLLIAVSERLRTCLRGDDTVARFGGDEFAILLEGGGGETEAHVAAERVLDALHAPVVVDGSPASVQASIGIAVGREAVTAGELVRDADIAMYAAKAQGRGCHRVFEPGMRAATLQRVETEADLRRAVDAGEMELHYQPIVELTGGRIVGAEALLRWRHPGHGLIGPAGFIPLAEETGVMLPLGRWVLEEACRQARAWQLEIPGCAELGVSVNLSPVQLARDLVPQVGHALTASGLRPRSLTVELTENVLIRDVASAIEKLARLQHLGVKIAIDDFGTGYASLGYLRRLPVDTLKLDKSFVDDIETDGEASALAGAIVGLAGALDLDFVAEGIEHAGQVERLRALGCRLGQGFRFARPLEPAAFAVLLRGGVVSPLEPASAA